MKQELDNRVMAAVIAALVVLIIAVYLFASRGNSGELTPAEAGLGPPVQPGMPSDPSLGAPPSVSTGATAQPGTESGQ